MIKVIKKWLVDTARVMARYYSIIFHDAGALLFFFGLPLLYPIVYTLIYNPEVVTDIPVAVIDHSCTAESRSLIRDVDALPAMQVYTQCVDLPQARDLMASGDVVGILEIPRDYAQDLGRGTTAHVPFYCDMSLLLRYRAFTAALTDLQLHLSEKHTSTMVDRVGAESLGISLPVNAEAHFLGDTEQGFASFVMPGIVVLILQQSMVLGICLLAGTAAERRRRNPAGIDPRAIAGAMPSAVAWGKALALTLMYIPAAIYVTRFIPWMFNLPAHADPFQYLPFLLPFLLGSAFFGMTLASVMKEREDGFILIVFTSVLFLFLSGLTWPRYAMSPFWQWVGGLVPGTWAVEGFIRMSSNGATLAQNSTPYYYLWALTLLYFLLAWAAHRHIKK